MSEVKFDADALIDAAAPLLGLVVDDASRPIVRTHLQIAAEMAALLAQEKLEDQQEPAAVFVP
jgi:hypothetical protein